MSGADDEVKIWIPRAMHEQIERKIRGTRFETVQDYVRALLQNALGEEASGADRRGLSSEDESQIKKKLKALGYI